MNHILLLKKNSHKRKNERNPKNADTFRGRLNDLIMKSGLSQGAIARAIGFDPRTFGHYCTGPTLPDIDVATSIANYFKVSLDYLLGRDSNPKIMPPNIIKVPKRDAEIGKDLGLEVIFKPKGFNETMKLVSYHTSKGATFLCDLNDTELSNGKFVSKEGSDNLVFSSYNGFEDQQEWKRRKYLPTGSLDPTNVDTVLEKDIQVLGRIILRSM